MGTGIDLGASRFRSLRRAGSRLIARQTPAVYSAIDATTDSARLISQARIPAIRTDDALLVAGGDAESFAAALSRPLLPLFDEGRLPDADPIARQVAAERLAGIVVNHPAGAAQACSVVMPGGVASDPGTRDFFLQLLRLHGYQPAVIDAVQAVGLAELGSSAFAGVVLCFGAASASLAIIEQGELAATADVPCGGAWIDRTIAEELRQFTFDCEGNQYLDTIGVARWKQTAGRSLAAPKDEGDAVLQRLYIETLTALLGRFHRTVVREGVNGPRRAPLTVVCQGGCTQIEGFLPLLERLWSEAQIDLPVAGFRLAQDDNWCVARGCLIHAEVATTQARTGRAA